jgi:hypothetical protein
MQLLAIPAQVLIGISAMGLVNQGFCLMAVNAGECAQDQHHIGKPVTTHVLVASLAVQAALEHNKVNALVVYLAILLY